MRWLRWGAAALFGLSAVCGGDDGERCMEDCLPEVAAHEDRCEEKREACYQSGLIIACTEAYHECLGELTTIDCKERCGLIRYEHDRSQGCADIDAPGATE